MNRIWGAAAWGLRTTTLKEQLQLCQELGLTGLELGIANAPMDIGLYITDKEIEELFRLQEEYTVYFTAAATGNDFTQGSYREIKEQTKKVKQVIRICEKLHIPILRIFAGFAPAEEVTGPRWEGMVHALSDVAEYGGKHQVIPAIETHGGVTDYGNGVEHFHSVTTRAEDIFRLLSRVPDSMRLVFDPANLYIVGADHPEELYRQLKDKIAYLHMKDFKRAPGGHYTPAACGEGSMDWRSFLNELEESVPCYFEYENTKDVAEGMKQCMDYLVRL